MRGLKDLPVTHLLSQISRFVFNLLLAAFGLVFALSLLAAALLVLVLSTVKALLTGKKPAPVKVFGQFQKFSAAAKWPGAAGRNDGRSGSAGSQIVDVEAREVRATVDELRLP